MKPTKTFLATAALALLAASPALAQSAYGTGWSRLAGGSDVVWEKGTRSDFAGRLQLGAGVYQKSGSFGYAAEGYATGKAWVFGNEAELVHLSGRADTDAGAALRFRLCTLVLADVRKNDIAWNKTYVFSLFTFQRVFAVGPIPVTFRASAGVITMFGLSLGIDQGVYLQGNAFAYGYVIASAVAGGSYAGCGAEAGVEATISILGTNLTPRIRLGYDGKIDRSMLLEVFGIRIEAKLFAWAGCLFVKASWEKSIFDQTYGGLARRDLLQ